MQITTTQQAYQNMLLVATEPDVRYEREIRKTQTAFEAYKQQSEQTIAALSARNASLTGQLAVTRAQVDQTAALHQAQMEARTVAQAAYKAEFLQFCEQRPKTHTSREEMRRSMAEMTHMADALLQKYQLRGESTI